MATDLNRFGRTRRESWSLRIKPELRRRTERLADRWVVNPSVIVEEALRVVLDRYEDESDRLDAEIEEARGG